LSLESNATVQDFCHHEYKLRLESLESKLVQLSFMDIS